MSIATTTRNESSVSTTRTQGLVCFVGGLAGVTQAAAMMAWPAAVSSDRYSYPLSANGYVIAQLSFFVQHLALIPGLLALAAIPIARRSRLARGGFLLATIGMVLLAIMELVAISAMNELATSDRASLINGLYGLPVIAAGIGLFAGGIGLIRTPKSEWAGPNWLRVLPAVMGAYVFVPLTPAIMGPFTLGRLAIGGWMALFAALGWGLSRPVKAHEGR